MSSIKENRQIALQDSLQQELLQTPYAKITIDSLCLRTGMHRKTFYRHYAGKDACLIALLDRRLTEAVCFEKDLEFSSIPNLSGHIAFWVQQEQLLDALAKNNLNAIFFERAIHHLVSEDLRSCCDKEYEKYRLQFIASGILSVLQYWHSNGRQESLEQLLHKIKCILTTPLGSLLEFVDM